MTEPRTPIHDGADGTADDVCATLHSISSYTRESRRPMTHHTAAAQRAR